MPDDRCSDTDSDSDTSTCSLPPPLISADDYDVLVCASCVNKTDLLRRYAGTQGAIVVTRDDDKSPWKTFQGNPLTNFPGNRDDHDILSQVEDCRSCSPSSQASVSRLEVREPKRRKIEDPLVSQSEEETKCQNGANASLSQNEGRESKRRKTDDTSSSPSCLAPPLNAMKFACKAPDTNASASLLGAGDVFLTKGWRQRWCQCDQVSTKDVKTTLWTETSLLPSAWHLFKHILTYSKKRKPMSHLKILTPVRCFVGHRNSRYNTIIRTVSGGTGTEGFRTCAAGPCSRWDTRVQ